jgi:hypothetical protein
MEIQELSMMMDHSSHMMDHSMDGNSEPPMGDCCDMEGGCSMSGCISLAIPNIAYHSSSNYSSESVVSTLLLDLSTTPSSHYRPPILS